MKVPAIGTCHENGASKHADKHQDIHRDSTEFVVQLEDRETKVERSKMEQLMETGTQELSVGPRHARSVTLKGRLLWALDKGPARWTWKTNLGALIAVVATLVLLGVATLFAVTAWFIDFASN